MTKRAILCAAIGALSIAAPAAYAATATGTLAVTATVLDTCIVAATPMTFVDIDGGAATGQTTPGVITVTCTSSKTGVDVTLGAGGAEASGQRYMTGLLSNTLPYDIYSDSAHTASVSVDGSIYTGDITAAIPEVIPVYGQIPSGAYNTDQYADNVDITVTYP